ncbi:glutamate synthase central domain-containing protein, partial [Enterococcus faecium]|uniref:glutamate synthase central domain-containing protein n=1 Tax=Enterococcus faecium TaxID=1352 RepID=UPI0030C856BD
LQPNETNCQRIQIETPILSNQQMNLLKSNLLKGFKSQVIRTLFSEDFGKSINKVFQEVNDAILDDVSLLILSDREMDKQNAAMPALLVASAVHHHLVRQGLRAKVSIIVESGEVREVHHFAALIGYGVDAIHPYLALATYKHAVNEGKIPFDYTTVTQKYIKGITEGVVKVMSEIGISTVQSYRGAQIFEAVGVRKSVMEQYFTVTVSQLDGIEIETIAEETKKIHEKAFTDVDKTLDAGSDFQWRKTGEHHAFNPKTIHTLQWATRKNDYQLFKQYSKA